MDEIRVLREAGCWSIRPDIEVREAAAAALRKRMRLARGAGPQTVTVPSIGGSIPRLAAVGLAILGVMATVVAFEIMPPSGTQRSAFAATPPPLIRLEAPAMTAGPVLHAVALASEAQPPLPTSRYNYLRTSNWFLTVEAQRDGTGEALVIPRVTEQWLADDGSGVVGEAAGSPLRPAAPGAANDAQSLDGLPAGELVRTEYGEGERFLHPVGELPPDAAGLRASLLRRYGATTPPVAAIYDSLIERLMQRRLEPTLLASFYRLLAAEDAMRFYGDVTDRGGRRGIAVGFDSTHTGLPKRHMLIVDASTGTPLSFEEMLTTDPGQLDTRVPAVVAYVIFHAGGRVESTEDRGPSLP